MSRRRVARRFLKGWLLIGATCFVGVVASIHSARFGAESPAETRTLAPGISYEKRTISTPRPMVVHIARIELSRPELEFLVTPPADGDTKTKRPFFAETTTTFVDRFQLLLAINGDYFEPFSKDLLDPRPRLHEEVETLGPSASQGLLTTPPHLGYFARHGGTMFISRDRKVTFEHRPDDVYNAVSGGPVLVRDGKIAAFPKSELHPQTAVGITADGRQMAFVVVDGRQKGYSEGMTNHELAELFLEIGIHHALRLDGGGSSTIVTRAADGRPEILNRPIHLGIPGNERPVANHIGIYLRPLRTAAVPSSDSTTQTR